MPKLPNNPNPVIPTNLLFGGELFLAMQTLTEPFRRTNEALESLTRPIRQAQEAMENAILPIKIIQGSLNTSFAPMIKAINAYAEIAETHRKMFESVSLLGFNNNVARSVGLGLFPKGLRFGQVIDGEIIEIEEEKLPQRPLTQQMIALPQPQVLVPALPGRSRYQTRSRIGLKEITGGSFEYKRRILKKISTRSCDGRLLGLFLNSEYLFTTDEDIRTKLHIPDKRSFSWVLRNLKKKLRANGLSGIIERRWDPDGYILIDISYMQ